MPIKSKKEVAKEFLTLCAQGRSREAFGLYAGRAFKHHNAFFKGDAESLMSAMEENAKQNPNKVLEIKNALQDGNFVALYSFVKLKPNDLGVALVHILKFESNEIVELWDLGQSIPESMINENGMF